MHLPRTLESPWDAFGLTFSLGLLALAAALLVQGCTQAMGSAEDECRRYVRSRELRRDECGCSQAATADEYARCANVLLVTGDVDQCVEDVMSTSCDQCTFPSCPMLRGLK